MIRSLPASARSPRSSSLLIERMVFSVIFSKMCLRVFTTKRTTHYRRTRRGPFFAGLQMPVVLACSRIGFFASCCSMAARARCRFTSALPLFPRARASLRKNRLPPSCSVCTDAQNKGAHCLHLARTSRLASRHGGRSEKYFSLVLSIIPFARRSGTDSQGPVRIAAADVLYMLQHSQWGAGGEPAAVDLV